MPERPTPAKAEFINLADESKKVTCHFNPDSITIDKTVNWSRRPSIGDNAAPPVFSGGEPLTLTLTDLLFDATDTGNDVRNTYRMLTELAMIDPGRRDQTTGQSEPPSCRFQWGKLLSFKAVIESVTQTFTLFKPDGTPLRARVTVKIKEVPEPPPPQNPTSHSEARKVWVVQEGQRLDWIAYQEYGDPARWRHIAQVNNLDNPFELQAGQALKLTPLL
ncbi:MAG: peptidoglycan-binding protein [Chloroflexota bacterium]